MGGPCWVEQRGSGQEKAVTPLHCDIISVPARVGERRLQVARSVMCWSVRGEREREIQKQRGAGIFLQLQGKSPFGFLFSPRSLPWLQCLMDVPFYLAPLFTCSVHGGVPGLGLSPSSLFAAPAECSHPCQAVCQRPPELSAQPQDLFQPPESYSTAHWTSPPLCPLGHFPLSMSHTEHTPALPLPLDKVL